MSMFIPDRNKSAELIMLYDDIAEPTPTQFQEAHKKWRRILDEKEDKIRELIQELHIAKEKINTLSKQLNNNAYHVHTMSNKPLDINTPLPVLEYETKETIAYANKLKQEVDKLRMSNQEKDIEIQELRNQVTQQAQRWLVPNFK